MMLRIFPRRANLALSRPARGFLVGAAILGAALPSHAGASEPYRLQAQDRVRIHLPDWPALTGEATLDSANRISLPTIGEIDATGATTAELAERIAQALRAKVGLDHAPDASVAIAAYRPFYVLGYVAAPGEYAYRPGMLVLNALGIAGGTYRRESGGEWPVVQAAVEAQGELGQLAERTSDLRGEAARLEAELRGAPSFGPASPEAADLSAHARQQPIFEARREEAGARRKVLEGTVSAAEAAHETLSTQVAEIDERLMKANADLDRLRALAKRSLALDRLYELERTVTQAEGERQTARLALLRADAEAKAAGNALSEFEVSRRAEILASLQRNEAEARGLAKRRDALRQTLRYAMLESSEATERSDDAAPELAFDVVRPDGKGGVSEFPADETTRLQPGDILKVSRVMPTRQSSLVGLEGR